MNYCVDTWFLLKLLEKDQRAINYIQDAYRGKTRIIISTIVIAEVTRKLFQYGKNRAAVEFFISSLEETEKISIVTIDKRIASEAATISFTHGVPLIDSLIAATTKIYDCHALLAKDAHYSPLVKKRYIKLVNW